MVVEYFHIMYMVDYKPNFPLELRHTRMVEREVRGNVVTDIYTNIPNQLSFSQIKFPL